MNEARKNSLADIFKWIGIILTAIGLIWGVTKFLITKELEAQSSYLDYQLTLYQETAKVASILVNEEPRSALYVKNNARFYQLFWGELVLVENGEVEEWMAQFRKAMEGESRYLKSYAYCLTHAFRKHLSETWKVEHWVTERIVEGGNCAKLLKVKIPTKDGNPPPN